MCLIYILIIIDTMSNNNNSKLSLSDDVANHSMLDTIFPTMTESYNKFLLYEICSNGANEMKLVSVKDLYTMLTQEIYANNDIENCDQLNLRDLRRIDYKLNPNEEAVISVRKHTVIFSIDTTRAIITANKLLFIVPNGADSVLHMLCKHMNTWDPNYCSFENHTYDGLLLVTKSIDETHLDIIKTDTLDIIAQLKKKSIMPLKLQERIQEIKNKLVEKSKHFTHIKLALNDLLDNDEKMAMMNLSIIATQPNIFQGIYKSNIHEKTESVIEVYLYDFNGLLSEVDLLIDKIKHSEQFALFRLSSIRNQLMIVNTILAILTCVIGFCGYIASLFGMNLDNVQNLQPISGTFNGVVISTIIFIPLITFIVAKGLEKYGYVPILFNLI